MSLSYNKTRQIEILELTIKKQNKNQESDIISLMDQFIIYEDLFQASLTARLIFRDQINLVGTFPIVGGEIVKIKYKTPIYTETVSLEFIVYKVGERGMSAGAENIQINQLFLCTPEVWFTSNNDVSESYKGTYDEIISKVLSNTGTKKPLDKESSVGIVEYVAPAWDVFRVIKFCASRANSKTSSPMLFWETPSGFKFKSLKELYRDKYDKFIYIANRAMSGADADSSKVFNTAYQFEYLESNNRLDQYEQNAFGAENYSVDINNARISKVVNTYQDLFNKQDIKLNKYPLNDDGPQTRLNMGYVPFRKDQSHNGAFYRRSSLAFMDNLKVLVNIPGDSKLEAGDVVWLDIPVQVGLEIGLEAHSSGKWLARSIKHLITKTTYSMNVELTKDSFDADINK